MNCQQPMNSYIPKVPEKKSTNGMSIMTYIYDLKYKNFNEDMGSHFSRAKIVSFDLIYHQCRGDKLNNPMHHYKITCDKDFKN